MKKPILAGVTLYIDANDQMAIRLLLESLSTLHESVLPHYEINDTYYYFTFSLDYVGKSKRSMIASYITENVANDCYCDLFANDITPV